MSVPMPQLHSVLYGLREAGTMSAEEEEKSEDLTKADKAHYEREMNAYIAAKRRPKRSSKIQCTKATSFCLLLVLFRQESKDHGPGLSTADAEEMGRGGEVQSSILWATRSPVGRELKGKTLPTELMGTRDSRKGGWSRLKGARERGEEDEEEDEEGEEEAEEEEAKADDNVRMKLVLAQFFSLSIKYLSPLYTTSPF